MNVLGLSGLHQSVPFKQARLHGLTPREYRIVQGLDSAAALVTPAGIVAAAAEERFSREKGTGSFPCGAIQFCLQAGKLRPDDIDYLAHGFSYEPYRAVFEAGDDFTRDRFKAVYAQEAILQTIEDFLPGAGWGQKLAPVEHHLAHAASAYYPSGFAESLIVVSDGMGEMHSTTVAVGEGGKISVLRQIPSIHSLGILYGVFTLYLGFFMNCDEYKVMGLAPYGNPGRYFDSVMQLVDLKDDGTYSIPILFRNNGVLEQETYAGTLGELTALFGPPREPGSEITQRHKDLAAALQAVLQTTLFHLLRHFRRETGQRNLCLAGGVALNCSANGVIRRSNLFERVFVQPAAGDDGTSLGAALYVQHVRCTGAPPRTMGAPLWGPAYAQESIARALGDRPDCEATRFESYDDLAQETARRLADGQIVAWFQGRMEFGPRALGNRSILADPRDPDMRERLNRIVKKREAFRPFAPAVPAEDAYQFFEIRDGDEETYASMLFVTPVRREYRARLPAITHVDGSARLQTVSEGDNPRFWRLLREFGALTGVPVLLNTSFNVRGQPIVCSPAEALQTFASTDIDVLVIGDYLVTRSVAPRPEAQEAVLASLPATAIGKIDRRPRMLGTD